MCERINPETESVRLEQCPGCPLGNSLPLVPGEDACGVHVWWAAGNDD